MGEVPLRGGLYEAQGDVGHNDQPAGRPALDALESRKTAL
jgi:hypothetical protein